ncbi:cation diffusion facilitator family transporter [Parasediminibacterium paludis]|uniref:Cation diffusion facilitator family transporter n=1 Tax=Parasediminibacterium paludis TaxID=908966 RepID=A0ABV8PUX4_9BACT
MQTPSQQNFRVQLGITVLSVVLFATKIIAYFLTHSLAILTDALESIVNVLAGFIGLYSLYVAAKPKDSDHPYGHGKAEFVSSAVEGTLIIGAGILIIGQTIQNLIDSKPIASLDKGLILVGITGLINYVAGNICLQIGRRNNSLALESSGKHLQLDTYSTIAIIVGLVVILYTHWNWLDTAIALSISGLILYNGYRIIRKSLAGIMDEADDDLLKQFVTILNANRKQNWIDLHNLRVIKYGSTLHVDCHLTVPWYLNIHQAHEEIDELSAMIEEKFGKAFELFVHTDGCMPFSCSICDKMDCTVRQYSFTQKIPFTLENISSNLKHGSNNLG